VGLNVYFTVHVCPFVYAVPTAHVPPDASLKSKFGAPFVSTLMLATVPLAVKVRVAVCTSLVPPTGVGGACAEADAVISARPARREAQLGKVKRGFMGSPSDPPRTQKPDKTFYSTDPLTR
jgi:hypothetical protein